MAAFLGGGRLGQPRRLYSPRRASGVPTCRKRCLHGREAARKRTGQGCRQGVRRERLPGGVVGLGGRIRVFFSSRAGRGVSDVSYSLALVVLSLSDWSLTLPVSVVRWQGVISP